MKKTREYKFKKGAASFYIVAFSTLILLIVATSFATIIISEITRTSNEDLSQSAYDSAMAGVEDAKLAYFNYQNCVNGGGERCNEIINIMRGEKNCEMVNTILGRSGEIIESKITGSNIGNNDMQQAYSCVKINTILDSYENSLTSTNPFRVIDVKFASEAEASKIDGIRVSWYNTQDQENGTNYLNALDVNKGKGLVSFSGIGAELTGSIPKPPVISVAVLQTDKIFTLADFDETVGNATDRGMVYLVPSEAGRNRNIADNSKAATLAEWGIEREKAYVISEEGLLTSNNHSAINLPYTVPCNGKSETFLCSAIIKLPMPVAKGGGGGTLERNPNTFKVIVAKPYGVPDADFNVELLCGNNDCGNNVTTEEGNSNKGVAYLDGVQIEVDSTGRANDLYRRIVTRLENMNGSSLSVMGPLELLGDDKDDANKALLEKNYSVTSEWNF